MTLFLCRLLLLNRERKIESIRLHCSDKSSTFSSKMQQNGQLCASGKALDSSNAVHRSLIINLPVLCGSASGQIQNEVGHFNR